jgi:regulator of protease activity HflC (stomatin/prohibitin superfamily)
LSACNYASVGSGEVAVVRTPTGVENHVYTTGDWKIGGDDHAKTYSIRSQERTEKLDVQSVDGLAITLETSIRFHIIPNDVIALDRELGPDYYEVLIGPTLRSQARRVVGRFKPDEIYSTQRELIERQIRDGIEIAIKGRHIELEAVLVRNVTLPPEIQEKITQKLASEQEALQMQFVLAKQDSEDQQKLMQTKAEAERQKIEAEAHADTQRASAQAEADAARVTAQAAADAKRLDAQATADYEKLVGAHLTSALLQLRAIEAQKALAGSPNEKLVFLGGQPGSAILDMRAVSIAK